MEIRYFKHYSGSLNRDMEFKVYGHGGKPVLFVPCQGGRFFDFENYKMIDYWAGWIESGRVTVYACDVIDNETYANFGGDPRQRIELHERWYHYIVDELVPYIKHLNGERTFRDQSIMTFGCSMGAMHAGIFFFRRPDLFDNVLALSGIYDSSDAFGFYMDDLLYQNSPCHFLQNMPNDHHYIGMYNSGRQVFCVGQGAWEDELKVSTGWLGRVLYEKGINSKVEFWGHDVDHHWNWWYKQVVHYLPWLLGERDNL